MLKHHIFQNTGYTMALVFLDIWCRIFMLIKLHKQITLAIERIFMNILVLSDTHGETARAEEIFHRLNPAASFDLIIHCGDYQKDAVLLEKRLGVKVVSVPGNCDGCKKRNFKVVDTSAGRILVTHGYAEDVKNDFTRVYYLALENDCIAACFGHSHIPVETEIAGVKLINPGSLTNPRGGSNPSCAIIATTEKSLTATIINY